MRLRFLVLAIATVLLIPTASAQAAGFVVHFKAPGHHPEVGKPWRIVVTATRTRSHKPIQAAAFYQFVAGGSVVSTQYPAPHGGHATKPYHFFGHFADTLRFPKRSVGQPLTFRVVVKAGQLGTRRVNYKIRVRG